MLKGAVACRPLNAEIGPAGNELMNQIDVGVVCFDHGVQAVAFGLCVCE
jgi:hypothetical protein